LTSAASHPTLTTAADCRRSRSAAAKDGHRVRDERWAVHHWMISSTGEAESLRGLQVDDELELGGLFNGKLTGLGALDDPDAMSTLASLPSLK
jgi:hypothetical protein